MYMYLKQIRLILILRNPNTKNKAKKTQTMQNAGAGISAGRPTKIDSTLANVRTKAGDLHIRLQELRDEVAQLRDAVGPVRNGTWYNFLQRFDTVKKTTAALTEEVERSLTEGLDSLVAVPAALTTDAATLPELLRTKLDTHVERDLESLAQLYHTSVQGTIATATLTPGAPAPAPAGAGVGAGGADVGVRVERYNEMVDAALDFFDEQRGALKPADVPDVPVTPVAASADAVLLALTSGRGLQSK